MRPLRVAHVCPPWCSVDPAAPQGSATIWVCQVARRLVGACEPIVLSVRRPRSSREAEGDAAPPPHPSPQLYRSIFINSASLHP